MTNKFNAHCVCICSKNLFYTSQMPSINLARQDNEDYEEMRGLEDLDKDIKDDLKEAVFTSEDAELIKAIQEKDPDISKIKKILTGQEQMPSKYECLLDSKPMQAYLRHFSQFKLTNQGLVLRLWMNSKGYGRYLLLLPRQKLKEILEKDHAFDRGAEQRSHMGQRRTYQYSGLQKVFRLASTFSSTYARTA